MSQNNIDSPEVRILSQDPQLLEKLVDSIDPAISGLNMVKLATLYFLVSGPKSSLSILLVGDPGTGKSSLLKNISSLVKSPVTRKSSGDEFLLIEKIDTLNHHEENKLMDTLEDEIQSVYASSRPLMGRYNPYQTVAQNLRLPVGVLSLFDLIFVLRDTPDRNHDREIASRILELEESTYTPPVDTHLLESYIEAARRHEPNLSHEAKTLLLDYYLSIRSSSEMEDAVAITSRQLNTLVKVSKARARIHLRDTVWASDAEAAIRMISHCLEQVGIDPVRCSYDIDVLYTGRPTVLNSKLLKVVEVFSELEKQSIPVHRSSLESILWERFGMTSRTVSSLLRSLLMEGIITEDPPGEYRRREWGQGDA